MAWACTSEVPTHFTEDTLCDGVHLISFQYLKKVFRVRSAFAHESSNNNYLVWAPFLSNKFAISNSISDALYWIFHLSVISL